MFHKAQKVNCVVDRKTLSQKYWDIHWSCSDNLETLCGCNNMQQAERQFLSGSFFSCEAASKMDGLSPLSLSLSLSVCVCVCARVWTVWGALWSLFKDLRAVKSGCISHECMIFAVLKALLDFPPPLREAVQFWSGKFLDQSTNAILSITLLPAGEIVAVNRWLRGSGKALIMPPGWGGGGREKRGPGRSLTQLLHVWWARCEASMCVCVCEVPGREAPCEPLLPSVGSGLAPWSLQLAPQLHRLNCNIGHCNNETLC